MIGALAPLIDAGRVKFFSVNSMNRASFYNKRAHPFHRSYMQSQLDSYLREEVVPFIWNSCQSHGIGISTMGASFGAYHAANTLVETSGRDETLLRAFRRLRHPRIYERNVRRQHLLQ